MRPTLLRGFSRRLSMSRVGWAGSLALGLCLAGAAVLAQSMGTLRVFVAVIDADLNVKPVPRHVLLVRMANGAGDAARLVTGFDGKTEIKLTPGTYTLESDRPVDFQGHAYRWKETVVIHDGAATVVELSVDNAVDASGARAADRRDQPGTPPGAAQPAQPTDLQGTWEGQYAGFPAELTIDRQAGEVWSGAIVATLNPGKTPFTIEVALKASRDTIEMKELSIRKRGVGSWTLGTSTATISEDGKRLTGTKRIDRDTYDWTFTRR